MLLLWETVVCKSFMPSNRACRVEQSWKLQTVPGANISLKGIPLPPLQGQAGCQVLNYACTHDSLQKCKLAKSTAKDVKWYLHEDPRKSNTHLSHNRKICVFPQVDYGASLYILTFTLKSILSDGCSSPQLSLKLCFPLNSFLVHMYNLIFIISSKALQWISKKGK